MGVTGGGRQKVRHAGKKVFGNRKSFQGGWKVNRFGQYPLASLEKRKALPQFVSSMIYEPREDYDKKKYYEDKSKFKDWSKNKFLEIQYTTEI